MKKGVMVIVAAVIFLQCRKSNEPCTPVSPESEEPQMVEFCNSNSIAYTKDSNGILYQIIDPGAGVTPTLESKISVTYTSTFLDENILDVQTTTPVTDYLYKFIEGWQLAIPYIQKGGHIKMVIPSSLCYGCMGTSVIPPNTPLYYDLVLIDVQ